MKTHLGLLAALTLVTTLSTAASAQPRHPHLSEAQKFTNKADRAIHTAQEANEFDLGGHAAKAMQFLDAASAQLRLATPGR
jgi:hypothetical protein